MRCNLLILPFFCFTLLLGAQSMSVPDLNTQYRGKILTLRHPFKSNSQNYDGTGQPIKAGKEGPWTLYGRLQILQITEQHGELRIRGKRTGLLNQNNRLSDYGVGQSPLRVPDPVGNVVSIHIQSSPGADYASVLGKIFALTTEDLLASVPELWKDYVRLRLDPQSSGGQWEFTPGQGDADRFSKPLPGVPGAHGQEVTLKTTGVTPPKAISTPEPDYGGEIGRALVHGTDKLGATIDEQGRVAHVAIIDPIGLGVDESTAAAMEKWKFEPGRLHGKPVPVNMTIEMEYRGRK